MSSQNKHATINLSNPQQLSQASFGAKTNVTLNGKPVYMAAQKTTHVPTQLPAPVPVTLPAPVPVTLPAPVPAQLPVHMPAQPTEYVPAQQTVHVAAYKTPGCCNYNTGPQVCEGCPHLNCDYEYECIKHEPVDCSCSTGGCGPGDCNCFQPSELKWWIGSM